MAFRFNVFKDDQRGWLEMTDTELIITAGKVVRMRPNYVSSVNKTGDLGLDRVGVQLDYFDLFGNKEHTNFAMHEAEFRALKKALGK